MRGKKKCKGAPGRKETEAKLLNGDLTLYLFISIVVLFVQLESIIKI